MREGRRRTTLRIGIALGSSCLVLAGAFGCFVTLDAPPDRADASPDASDTGPDRRDASPDQGKDSPRPCDAGRDQGDGASDVEPSRWCLSLCPQPVFCADFDEGTLKNPWTLPPALNNATISLSSKFHVSPPDSLEVNIPPVPEGGAQVIMMSAIQPRVSSRATFSFDVYLDVYDTTANYIKLADIQMADNHALYIEISDGGAISIAEEKVSSDGHTLSYPTYRPTPAAFVQVGAWHRVELQLGPASCGTGIGSASLSLDGKTLVSVPNLEAGIPPSSPTIELGVYYPHAGETAWRVYFDDVVFDIP
jgi:hypothetical protein